MKELDLTDPAVWAAGPPHDTFDAERAEAPVRWRTVQHGRRDLQAGSGYWSVTGYEAVRDALRNPALLSSSAGGIRMEDHSEAGLAAERRSFIFMDPPEHTAFRLSVNRHFVPRAVSRLTAAVERIAGDAVARLAATPGGRADLVAAVAAEVPLLVIAELLGVDPADRHRFHEWTDVIVTAEDPELAPSAKDLLAAIRALNGYGARLLAERRVAPRDDLLSIVAHAEVDGQRLDDEHQAAMWFMFLLGGNETTRNALSGAAVAFDRFGEQLALVRAEPQRWPAAIEEVLRWWSPVNYVRRTAVADVALAGAPIRAGDKVLLWITAANRDPGVFEEPHRFDVTRTPNDHLAFGNGTHFCIGSHLARLVLSATLTRLYDALPDLALDGEPVPMRANLMHALKRVPVRFSNPAA